MTTDQKIKELELQKTKLFFRALKLFPGSQRQKKISDQITQIFQQIATLKNEANRTTPTNPPINLQ